MQNLSVALGMNGPMPVVGFGTWQVNPKEIEQVVREAIKAGYRHFDCALIYQNEAAIGQALKKCFSDGLCSREDLFITSKVWNTYHRPNLVLEGCRKSLHDLQVDYIDLYLMHWPVAYEPGDELFPKNMDGTIRYDTVDPVVTWTAMEDLVTSGLVKSIGLSNFNREQIERIMNTARIKPSVLQVESHLGFLNQKIINFAKSLDIVVTAYSPLGSPGGRTGIVDLLQLPVVQKLTKIYGKTPAQILLRHALQRGLCVIPKSCNPVRISENIQLFDFQLSPTDFALLEQSGENVRRVIPTLMVNHPEFPFKPE